MEQSGILALTAAEVVGFGTREKSGINYWLAGKSYSLITPMQHLEPQQIQPPPEVKSPSRRNSLLWAGGVLALVAAMGWGGTSLFLGPDTDVVSQAERTNSAALLQSIKPLPVKLVPQANIDNAVAGMQLDAAKQTQLKQMLQVSPAGVSPQGTAGTETPRLVEFAVWDTHVADGDTITVTSAGYARDVVLSKQLQQVVVPVGSNGQITITGLRDGGGGITLGIKGMQQEELKLIMSEGQSIVLPIAR